MRLHESYRVKGKEIELTPPKTTGRHQMYFDVSNAPAIGVPVDDREGQSHGCVYDAIKLHTPMRLPIPDIVKHIPMRELDAGVDSKFQLIKGNAKHTRSLRYVLREAIAPVP